MITIGIGILISMIYTRRTGYGSGGLVSAGIIALKLYSPVDIFVSMAVAVLICPLLQYLVRRFGLHGRDRIGVAMLAALSVRLIAGCFIQPLPWAGWVIPGLIAADMQRQGVLVTSQALLTVAILTAFAAQWVFFVGGSVLL